MSRRVHVEVTYRHSRDKVWHALTSADAMSVWLMPNDFEPRVGHQFQFKTKPAPGFDGIVRCEVLEMVLRERLVYSWAGGGVDTRVIWTLADVPHGTRLTLDHEGFSGLRGFFVSGILGKGWRDKILPINLPALLDRWTGTGSAPEIQEAQCHRDHDSPAPQDP